MSIIPLLLVLGALWVWLGFNLLNIRDRFFPMMSDWLPMVLWFLVFAIDHSHRAFGVGCSQFLKYHWPVFLWGSAPLAGGQFPRDISAKKNDILTKIVCNLLTADALEGNPLAVAEQRR